MNKKGKHYYTIKNYYKYLEQNPKTGRERGKKGKQELNTHIGKSLGNLREKNAG